ncbi:HAD family hydrolase [Haloplanus halophilus]|uniref:HAD family hydrolase n=1 Tax=Haloplanus halophilus TaxID=2949993 RepID=UPI00203FC4C9|nr:HAD family hydrolase [Haloplanus sp. GDY1]
MVDTAYDFWLFDLDGTLVDVDWTYVRGTFDEVGDRLGHRFSDETAYALWHGIGDERRRLRESAGVSVERFWEVFDEVDDPRARAEATYLYDDAALLSDYDGPLGIVTHCPEPVTGVVLDHLDIRDWFETVVCCSPDVGMKPNPDPVRTAMGGLGATAADGGALVGDSAVDVGAAWNVDLDAIHIERHGHGRRGHCILCDRRIESIRELRGLSRPVA